MTSEEPDPSQMYPVLSVPPLDRVPGGAAAESRPVRKNGEPRLGVFCLCLACLRRDPFQLTEEISHHRDGFLQHLGYLVRLQAVFDSSAAATQHQAVQPVAVDAEVA